MPNINPATTNLEDNDFTQHANKAALRGVNLAQHRCARANFSGMDLTGTNFEQADCTDALFDGAVLDKANFTGAAITAEQIASAKSAKDVLLPTHLLPVEPPPPDPALVAEIERLKAELAAAQQKPVEPPKPPEPLQKARPR